MPPFARRACRHFDALRAALLYHADARQLFSFIFFFFFLRFSSPIVVDLRYAITLPRRHVTLIR